MDFDPEGFKVMRPPKADVQAATAKLVEDARKVSESPSAPKNHHIIPRWYLDQWTVDGKLRETETGTSHAHDRPSKKAGSEEGFYNVETPDIDPDELPPLIMEVIYSRLEADGKRLIEALVRGGVDALGFFDAVHLAVFLGLTHTRGRQFREMIATLANEALFITHQHNMSDDAIRARLHEQGLDDGDDAVSRMRDFLHSWERGEFTVQLQKAAQIGFAAQAGIDVGLHFLGRRWQVFESVLPLVTCDEPVVCIGGPRFDRGEQSALATAGVVVFPLDPHHVLAMFHPELALDEPFAVWPELLPEEAAELNLEIIGASAHRFTFERRRGAQALLASVPPKPPSIGSEWITAKGPTGPRELYHSFRRSRWWGCPSPPPWPVERWWRWAAGPGLDAMPYDPDNMPLAPFRTIAA